MWLLLISHAAVHDRLLTLICPSSNSWVVWLLTFKWALVFPSPVVHIDKAPDAWVAAGRQIRWCIVSAYLSLKLGRCNYRRLRYSLRILPLRIPSYISSTTNDSCSSSSPSSSTRPERLSRETTGVIPIANIEYFNSPWRCRFTFSAEWILVLSSILYLANQIYFAYLGVLTEHLHISACTEWDIYGDFFLLLKRQMSRCWHVKLGCTLVFAKVTDTLSFCFRFDVQRANMPTCQIW